MNRNGYWQYSQVQIKTANKGKLIVMLYQGAIRFMKKALIQLEQKDMEGKGKSLIRAQDVVLELLYALDQDMLAKGNELALNLQRLYLYCYRRLIRANVDMDPEAIKEVVALMTSLLEAWEKVLGSQGEGETETPEPAPARVAITG
ncbi:MAG: flagellar export chaperone FliS [Candidatus Handelsmanbacteria bacterium]|nr:flagellar export chaperone FliS [Candidatus Handelsmanbacteria bacterium]